MFTGLYAKQIGDESLLRNIAKQTAPCWMRSIYRYPPFANQIWQYWRAKLPQEAKINTPVDISKGRQKMTHVSDEIIKACPLCDTTNDGTNKRSSNLEHLHLYCNTQTLIKARFYCHQKIENAICELHKYASVREYGTSFHENSRTSRLQEELEKTALVLERHERPIVQNSQVLMDSRDSNAAILARHSLNIAVLLNRICSSKICDYDSSPLAHRLGFIHSLPESDFDVASATITDVGFLGLFPKSLLQILYQYAREVDKSGHSKDEFKTLVNKLGTVFM
jgi:hypothetical protein